VNVSKSLWLAAAASSCFARVTDWWLPDYPCPMALSPDGQSLAVGVNRYSEQQPVNIYLRDLKKVQNAN